MNDSEKKKKFEFGLTARDYEFSQSLSEQHADLIEKNLFGRRLTTKERIGQDFEDQKIVGKAEPGGILKFKAHGIDSKNLKKKFGVRESKDEESV